ncbi:lipase family protein [uncultured Chitinophaga sp.]|uniref:lipase family protein n=1 Tax=uncultured Chitinophaga sp. TaxID=339340 RepID=UPI0025F928DC|nr:lipase family protein [uncultured Chitinophaga sp.]
MHRFLLCLLISLPLISLGQKLKPGFDAHEYAQLLQLPERNDSAANTYNGSDYKLLFTSPEVGLYNKWFLWMRKDGVAVIAIRGTIGKTESWLANFYAAMIPAKGTIEVDKNSRFDYQLAADTAVSYVHAGWTVSLAAMAPSMVQKIKEVYQQGVKDIIIIGHSQGGAIAFLARSYFEYNKDLPKDIRYKTYCSAAPKPGNLYYAYDFDYITRGGWGFRVVNSEDWVPETPFSLQTLKDFNEVNAFMDIPGALKKQKFFVRIYGKSVYNKLNRASTKSMKRFRRTLGKGVSTLVRKTLPDLKMPAYVYSNNYMTAGCPVILMADDAYKEKFKFDGKNVFINHLFEPYLYLLRKQYGIQ